MTQFPDFAAKRAMLCPEKVAFRDLKSDRKLTFRQFDQQVAKTATLLLNRAVLPDDRVAVLCRNRIEFFELLFSCARIGAVLVPLNWRMPAAELLPMIQDAEPVVLFAGQEDLNVAREITGDNIDLLPLDDDENSYSALRDNSEPLEDSRDWPADDTWYLLYTSGTTGKPKAVIQTFGMAVANYVNISQAMSIRADDVTLNFLPNFHTAGINLVTLPTFFQGGEVLVVAEFDSQTVIDLFSRRKLDTFFAVPAIYQQISLHPDFDSIDLSCLRSWGCGGAPMPDELIRRYLERGARVCNGMGMTETGPTVFLMDANSVERKIGSVGKPQLLSSVRLVGMDGLDVNDNEVGELWFRGPGVTPGYFQQAAATAKQITADGWLKSGDLARRDADGYYYIVGRIKDMYISGGENIHPAEVENVLASHVDILDAAVVAVADDRWGEVGCAFLQALPNHRIPGAADLTQFCRTRLAAYKVPKSFVAVDDFPRTPAGKIQKHLLRATG